MLRRAAVHFACISTLARLQYPCVVSFNVGSLSTDAESEASEGGVPRVAVDVARLSGHDLDLFFTYADCVTIGQEVQLPERASRALARVAQQGTLPPLHDSSPQPRVEPLFDVFFEAPGRFFLGWAADEDRRADFAADCRHALAHFAGAAARTRTSVAEHTHHLTSNFNERTQLFGPLSQLTEGHMHAAVRAHTRVVFSHVAAAARGQRHPADAAALVLAAPLAAGSPTARRLSPQQAWEVAVQLGLPAWAALQAWRHALRRRAAAADRPAAVSAGSSAGTATHLRSAAAYTCALLGKSGAAQEGQDNSCEAPQGWQRLELFLSSHGAALPAAQAHFEALLLLVEEAAGRADLSGGWVLDAPTDADVCPSAGGAAGVDGPLDRRALLATLSLAPPPARRASAASSGLPRPPHTGACGWGLDAGGCWSGALLACDVLCAAVGVDETAAHPPGSNGERLRAARHRLRVLLLRRFASSAGSVWGMPGAPLRLLPFLSAAALSLERHHPKLYLCHFGEREAVPLAEGAGGAAARGLLFPQLTPTLLYGCVLAPAAATGSGTGRQSPQLLMAYARTYDSSDTGTRVCVTLRVGGEALAALQRLLHAAPGCPAVYAVCRDAGVVWRVLPTDVPEEELLFKHLLTETSR